MIPVFARRRAEEFDALVEGTSTGADDARYAELLDLVGSLRESTPVEPRAEFVADLRERLMAAAETDLVPASDTTTPRTAVEDRLTVARRSPRERRLAAAIGGLALVGATTSMAVAAQSALPGDVLYPLKRAIENAHTGLSVDDERKGSTLLANASDRLEEVNRLAHEAPAEEVDVRRVEETLATFTSQATEASDLLLGAYEAEGDEEALTELQEFTDRSFESLDQLAADVGDDVRAALVPVGNVLAAIETAIQEACPACTDVLTELPPWMLTSAEQLASSTLADLVGSSGGVAPEPEPGAGGSGGAAVDGKPDPAVGKPPAPAPAGVPSLPLPAPTGGAAGGGGSTGGGGTDPQPKPGKNVVSDLVNGLLGPGGGTDANGGPKPPTVGDVLQGVGEGVGGLLDTITQPLQPTPKP
ncbi:MAG TPA: DUF5667 domain-containing protein [Nocardioides sp.]|uniref:DUF5667 domain-containing protein n=1 Tax=Nocardioides sp. TaxID=35761 RepID=UPI002B60A744|nr:DUF5667 domain-containing protein [Nocardioides sp.]HTW14261.1 DUF5667 domain-containing protein [Nocardioides sp.]